MGKLDDAKKARDAAAQWRAKRVAPSPPEQTVGYITAIREVRAADLVGMPGIVTKADAKRHMKRGRPARANGVGKPLKIRLSAEEMEALREASKRRDRAEGRAMVTPLSAWARDVLLKEAGHG